MRVGRSNKAIYYYAFKLIIIFLLDSVAVNVVVIVDEEVPKLLVNVNDAV